MCEIAIRCEGGDFLTVTLHRRSRHETSDYWDGNWITASVEARAGGFRGTVGGNLRTEEVAAFHGQLAQLQESLRGTADFTAMEGWLSIRVEGDGRGHVACRCIVRNAPGIGNTLDCVLTTDQAFTRATVAELAAAVQARSIVGKP